ncbi:MAG: DUF4870 domain-containing protein [Flavobacteriales bacterium]|nr:DUF4870 domain-containing protein [Flavobacteriales bacterium]
MKLKVFLPLPQPSEISSKERERAMASYMTMMASLAGGLPLPFLNLLAIYLFHRWVRSTSRFVHFHSLQSMWSQAPVTILNSILLVWTIVRIFSDDFRFSATYLGFLIPLIVINVAYFIMSVVAGMRAYKGRFYYFPVFGRWAYEVAFDDLLSIAIEGDEIENKPPEG